MPGGGDDHDHGGGAQQQSEVRKGRLSQRGNEAGDGVGDGADDLGVGVGVPVPDSDNDGGVGGVHRVAPSNQLVAQGSVHPPAAGSTAADSRSPQQPSAVELAPTVPMVLEPGVGDVGPPVQPSSASFHSQRRRSDASGSHSPAAHGAAGLSLRDGGGAGVEAEARHPKVWEVSDCREVIKQTSRRNAGSPPLDPLAFRPLQVG